MADNAMNERTDTRHEERGMKRSFSDAWKIVVFQWRNYLRAMMIYSLVAGLGLTLFVYMCGVVARETLLPMYLLVQSGEEFVDVWNFYASAMVEWGVPLLVFLLWWGAHALWRSALMSQTEQWAEQSSWPSGCFPLRRLVFGRWRRLLLFDVIAFVGVLVLSGISVMVGLKASWWALLPVVLLAVFLLWTMVARIHYIYNKESVLKSYVAVVKHDIRRTGSMVMLLVMTGVVMLPLTLMFAFPYLIPECAATHDAIGQIVGDASALPVYFHWLYPLIGVLVGGFFYLVRGWQTMVLSLRCLPYRKSEKA